MEEEVMEEEVMSSGMDGGEQNNATKRPADVDPPFRHLQKKKSVLLWLDVD